MGSKHLLLPSGLKICSPVAKRKQTQEREIKGKNEETGGKIVTVRSM
jgi:hypothetical protein